MMNFFKKLNISNITIFLIIGFIISAYSVSVLISSCSYEFIKRIEENTFHKDYKDVIITTTSKKGISLKDMSKSINDKGIYNMTFKYMQTFAYNNIQSQCANNIIAASKNYNILNYCNQITGRNFSKNELDSSSSLAIIGKNLINSTITKNNKKYINIYDKQYEVIGIIRNAPYFSNTSIIPYKSLSFINNSETCLEYYIHNSEIENLYKLDNSKYNIQINEMPTVSFYQYLHDNKKQFTEYGTQLILCIITLFLFSVFFADSLKKELSIMKILGAKNKHIFLIIFIKMIKLAVPGAIIGIIFSSCSITMLQKSFPYTNFIYVNTDNTLLTFSIIILTCMLVSLVILSKIMSFKILKEIR